MSSQHCLLFKLFIFIPIKYKIKYFCAIPLLDGKIMKDNRTAMKSCSSKTYNLVCDGRLVFVCIKRKLMGHTDVIPLILMIGCNATEVTFVVASIYRTKFEGYSNLIEYVFISN